MKRSPTSPLYWWSGRNAGYPPTAPAATGRIQPRLSQINPLIWWAQHRGSDPGPPTASPGQLRPWIGTSLPLVVWSLYRPRGGEGAGPEPPYVIGDVYPSALAASSRLAAAGADPWAASTGVTAWPDPSAASTRRLGNRP